MHTPHRNIAHMQTHLGRLFALLVLVTCALHLVACSPAAEEESTSSSAVESSSVRQQLSGVVEDGKPLTDDVRGAIESSGSATSFTSEPVVVYQYPELESGCEIAALASALQAMGFNATPTEIADNYLVVDGDYRNGYLASPHTDYGGGFPPGIVKAANAYLEAQRSALRAHDLTGSSFGGVCALANNGYPVLVWTTLENNEPNYDPDLGGIEDWYVNEHCITIYGEADGVVTAADPLKGLVQIDAAQLATAFAKCGSMALFIR